MNNVSMSPMNRLKWLFIPVIISVIVLASLFTAVAQAESCLFKVGRTCVDGPQAPTVLQHHFVVEYIDNCQRISDVWTTADRPDIFDPVLGPIRSQNPDLQRYNSQFQIRANGEIGGRDLKYAIKRGLVEEVSRTIVDERCNAPVSPDPDPVMLNLAGHSPWQIDRTDVLTTYVHLQMQEPGDLPEFSYTAPLTDWLELPVGAVVTFLMTDEAHIQDLIEYLKLN